MSAQQHQQQNSEPVSILKNSSTNARSGPSDPSKNTRIVLSEDEEDEHTSETIPKYLSDGDDDDTMPISGKALELLQTEKSVKSGYLLKKGEKRRTWKRRWFVLRSTKLAMYKDSKEYKLLRIIDMNEIHSVIHVISNQKYKYMFAISTPRRMYYFQADNQDDMNDWIVTLEKTKTEHMQKTDDVDDTDIPADVHHHHVAFANVPSQQQKQEQQQQQQQRRRYSGASAPPPLPKRRSSSASGGASTTFSASARHHVLPVPAPVEIPKAIATNDLAAYSPSRTYPLSPTTDHHHLHLDGLSSSEDEDEDDGDQNKNSYESRQVQQEKNRNRVLMEGYLLKLGRNKGWRKRWFVLRTDSLVYYEDDKEYAPHRIIPLVNVLDSLEIDPVSRSKQFCFKIVIQKRNYILCADSEMMLESWLNALSVAVRRAKKSQGEHSQNHPETPPLERIATCTSSILENTSHISGVDSAGAIGGVGSALPSRAHTHRHLVRGA